MQTHIKTIINDYNKDYNLDTHYLTLTKLNTIEKFYNNSIPIKFINYFRIITSTRSLNKNLSLHILDILPVIKGTPLLDTIVVTTISINKIIEGLDESGDFYLIDSIIILRDEDND